MYLHNATGLDEVISFGINPLIALLDHYEDEFLDLDDPESKSAIFWNEIKGKTLLVQEKINDIHQRGKKQKR